MKELVGTLRYLLDFEIHFILSIYCSQQTIIYGGTEGRHN